MTKWPSNSFFFFAIKNSFDSTVFSSAVEHGIADPVVAGSIPAAPFCFLTTKYVLFENKDCFQWIFFFFGIQIYIAVSRDS